LTISDAQRRQTEERIRAAADRLLRGQIPSNGGCDIQTLAIEAGVSRASLYRTYLHLKNEFGQRLARLQAERQLPDPRAAQIIRLNDDNDKLRQRATDREPEIADLSAFKTTALSRLAAQHQEITALRAALANRANVRTLPATLKPPDSQQGCWSHSCRRMRDTPGQHKSRSAQAPRSAICGQRRIYLHTGP
jgi:hypothetical protein